MVTRRNLVVRLSILCVLTVGLFHTYAQNEVVEIPASSQNIYDVIVLKGKRFVGFQTRITNVSEKHIHYVIYKRKGEKDKKIRQRKVAFTLSFNENAKQEKYPEQMNVIDFLSLPTYYSGIGWTTFGTGISNISQLKNTHPNICINLDKGVTLSGIAYFMYSISWLVGGIPLIITGGILDGVGSNRMNDAFMEYYTNCLDLDVCAKYGIIITPYNTSLPFK